MVGLDEEALTCDFAEVYHVLDWRALPAMTAATLASGLGPTSRIIKKMSGTEWPLDTLLLAMVADGIRIISWQLLDHKTRRGMRPPQSILEQLTGKEQRGSDGFDSPEEFRAWRASILEG